MEQKDVKLLKVFLATSGYTIRALEEAIGDLKGAATVTDNIRLRSFYLDKIEYLEYQLYIINKLGQE